MDDFINQYINAINKYQEELIWKASATAYPIVDFKELLDKKQKEIIALNREGKINEILNDIPYKEILIEETEEYENYQKSLQPNYNGLLSVVMNTNSMSSISSNIINEAKRLEIIALNPKPQRDYQQEKYRKNRKHKK